MSKDHIPSDFSRESGYKSDLEIAETQPGVKRINTSFGSKNHNAYIMFKNGTHEHFYADPATGKTGWHGANFETKNNKPKNINQNINQNTNNKGEKNMAERTNAFLEGLKVDQATMNRLNEVSKKAAQNQNQAQNNSSKSKSEGGRERGDTGPGAKGREGGAYKGGESNSSGKSASPTGHTSSSTGHGTSGSTAGHSGGSSSGGHGTSGSTGGHGTSGSTGGHGGSGGGTGGHGGGSGGGGH